MPSPSPVFVVITSGELLFLLLLQCLLCPFRVWISFDFEESGFDTSCCFVFVLSCIAISVLIHTYAHVTFCFTPLPTSDLKMVTCQVQVEENYILLLVNIDAYPVYMYQCWQCINSLQVKTGYVTYLSSFHKLILYSFVYLSLFSVLFMYHTFGFIRRNVFLYLLPLRPIYKYSLVYGWRIAQMYPHCYAKKHNTFSLVVCMFLLLWPEQSFLSDIKGVGLIVKQVHWP